MDNRMFSNGIYEEVSSTFIPENKKNRFIVKLNIYAILIVVILFIPTLKLFGSFEMDINGLGSTIVFFVFIFSFLVYVVVHELLHGISFVLFGKVKIKELKFGVIWKSGMAYCISTVPVKIGAARISLMMPVYAVCIPLYILGILMDSFGISLLAILFLSGSIADFYYMWASRKASKDYYMFEEMPTVKGYEIGYRLYKKVSE